ncbi:hypothetical protein PEBR_04317 [Penicillium brasilianum]|uniref:Uncharacterized protein n=1 Tax=Penicillium brasilianum TaxID=104259 RepID=A0A1S9RYD6_PENBI|nr:hypothetical protein PEBR_04317 [Penicillium brasilianum]
MAFWVDWALWEQLSFVFVFVYASCVHAFNTWMTGRYAEAESRQKDEEADLYPMLSRDDVPFGAKALERGVQVEGIWVSSHNTPHSGTLHPETPSTDQPASHDLKKYPVRPPTPASSTAIKNAKNARKALPADTPTASSSEVDIPGAVYTHTALSQSPSLPSSFNHHSESFVGDRKDNQKRASFHSRIWRAGGVFDNEPAARRPERDKSVSAQGGNVAVPHSPNEQHRASRISRVLRKRSSEEFRRKMSAIFNERIHMNAPSEGLEIDPMFRSNQDRHKRTSIVTQSRSWDN